MPKNSRSGQAAILSRRQFNKLQSVVTLDHWRMFYELLWHTGERYGAVRQLRVTDVFKNDGTPLEHVTYRAQTRKHSAGKKARTRQVWINENLRACLQAFPVPDGELLFPGRSGDRPISVSACDKQFRHYLDIAGLSRGGYSLHSFRRSFITRAAKQGIGIATIQIMTGHQDVRSLIPYIETDEAVIRNAMTTIA